LGDPHRCHRLRCHGVASACSGPSNCQDGGRRKAKSGERPVTLVSLDTLYLIAGLLLAFIAVSAARNRSHRHRVGTSVFWGLFAVIYIFGKQIPPMAVGWTVCALAILAAIRQVSPAPETPVAREQRTAAAMRLGNRIFFPALVIPATAIVSTL